jgi:beta-N-acetylhexosaminidase
VAVVLAAAALAAVLLVRHLCDPVTRRLGALSLRERLAQLLVVRFDGPVLSPDADTMLRAQKVGGVVLYAKWGNVVDETQLRMLGTALHGATDPPPLIAIDQEGGRVDRLAAVRGVRPAASALAATGIDAVTAAGTEDARDLARLGIALNLAPVVDVEQVDNRQLAKRTFGRNPDDVARLAGAYLEALQRDGQVAGTLKHFPGLGGVAADPHDEIPRVTTDRARLDALDWQPYRELIARGDVAAVMVTHVFVDAIDPRHPASLSPALIDGVLRGELGFDGVVIADALTMKGVASDAPLGDVALASLLAGTDLLMGPASSGDVEAILDRLERAVSDGDLAPGRVDAAARRVLALKARLGLLGRGAARG